MGQFLRLIAVVVLDDVGTMWVRYHRPSPSVPQIFFEEVGVSAVYLVAYTFCKSSELFGEGFSPNFLFVTLYEVAVLLGLVGDRVSDGG